MMDPFLKWAGGKRWLRDGRLPIPTTYNRYVEPFLGGGAVFFSLLPQNALISDVNEELINLYRSMRDSPERLRRMLEMHHALHKDSHYYDVRSWIPSCSVERAARMLYLNRTCWNGLYRVNRRGEFNVPVGTKSKVIMPEDDFIAIAEALAVADIRCNDFEITMDDTGDGDFVFVDPPYTVKHNRNGFVKYNETIFSWADQERLRDAVARAVGRGAAVVVTNADHPSVIELYAEVGTYTSLERASVLAGKVAGRGQTTEAMFVSNFD